MLPEGHEEHGLHGAPQYVPGASFDPETRTGLLQLAPDSPGSGAAVVVPNNCEPTGGRRPDVGAQQPGTPRMQFGLKARFVPPEVLEATTGCK